MPSLFEEYSVSKNLTLKNRLAMLPMGNACMNPDGSISDRQIDFYEERAKGGFGLLFPTACVVNTDFEDFEEMTYIGFDDQEMLNYFVTKPTDYPDYAADAEVCAEYNALFAEVDAVIEGIQLANAA